MNPIYGILLGAAIGAAASIGAAHVSNKGNQEAIRQQLNAQKQEDRRSELMSVYKNFLDEYGHPHKVFAMQKKYGERTWDKFNYYISLINILGEGEVRSALNATYDAAPKPSTDLDSFVDSYYPPLKKAMVAMEKSLSKRSEK